VSGVSAIAFVDAHHHLWDLEQHRYAWLEGGGVVETTAWIGDYAAIRRSHLVPDFLSEAAGCGLTGSVHVEAGWSDGDPVGETRWIDALAEAYGHPDAIVARVDLRAPGAERSLDEHAQSSRLRGVRMTEMHDLVDSIAFRRGLRALARRRLSYDLNTCVPWIEEGVRLAALAPDIPVIVGNAGNPRSHDPGELEHWEAGMRRLAAIENVAVKISGLGMWDHRWTGWSIEPIVRRLVDLFTPARVMFGSNWPVDSLYGSYADLIATYRSLSAEYTIVEQHLLLHETAERCYRL
jgi:predicted TIM-barrel fold metal-dependent hydrolase